MGSYSQLVFSTYSNSFRRLFTRFKCSSLVIVVKDLETSSGKECLINIVVENNILNNIFRCICLPCNEIINHVS